MKPLPNRYYRQRNLHVPWPQRLAAWGMFVAVMLLALAPSSQAAITLTPSVDQGRINKPFELVIESTQYRSASGSPDLSPLQQDFRILSNRSIYLTKRDNGRTLYISRWTLNLSPKRTGTLVIPPIRVKGELSPPLSFQVLPKPRPKAPPLQLETVLSSTEGYPGTPLSLTVQLFYNITLQHAELTQPTTEGLRFLPQGTQRSYSQQRNSNPYQVIEQRYWLQALKPGDYQIPALHFTVSDERGKQVTGESQPLALTIVPLPPALAELAGGQLPLISSQVSLQQQWQRQTETAQAGDTLIRSIIIEAQGLPAQWLPDIRLASVDGISVYSQPAQLQQTDLDGVLTSRKQVDFKLLLTKSGQFQLPPVTLNWWDSSDGSSQTALLESMPLDVAPFSANIAATQTTAGIASKTTASATVETVITTEDTKLHWQAWVWAALSLICAAGWTLSLQRNRRLEAALAALKPAQATNQKTTHTLEGSGARQGATQQIPTGNTSATETLHNNFEELAEACQLNDPELAYERLFNWADVRWPHAHVDSLEDIQALAKDPTLTYLLKNLEHQLSHPGNDSWHGDLLLQRIIRLRKSAKQPAQATTVAPAPSQPTKQPSSSRPPAHKPFRVTIGE
ncbi:MAG: BatD family protein [Motiliproteus sp.]